MATIVGATGSDEPLRDMEESIFLAFFHGMTGSLFYWK